MRRLIRPLLLASLFSASAFAYPITPRTLWDLASEAQVIVVAQVSSVVETPNWPDKSPSAHAATLQVERVLKGQAPAQIVVRFEPTMRCPAPPVYTPGRQVFAFLSRDERGRWYTNALSYGTRSPADASELDALERLVRRAVELRSSASSPEHAPDDWSLEAVANRATRWDGLSALDSKQEPLSDATLAALERIAVEAPSYDKTLTQMLTLLAARTSADVTAASADAIEAVLHQGRAERWLADAIRLLEARLGVPPSEVLESTRLLHQSVEERDAAIRQRWTELKKQHDLTPKVRADFVKPERSQMLP